MNNSSCYHFWPKLDGVKHSWLRNFWGWVLWNLESVLWKWFSCKHRQVFKFRYLLVRILSAYFSVFTELFTRKFQRRTWPLIPQTQANVSTEKTQLQGYVKQVCICNYVITESSIFHSIGYSSYCMGAQIVDAVKVSISELVVEPIGS